MQKRSHRRNYKNYINNEQHLFYMEKSTAILIETVPCQFEVEDLFNSREKNAPINGYS